MGSFDPPASRTSDKSLAADYRDLTSIHIDEGDDGRIEPRGATVVETDVECLIG